MTELESWYQTPDRSHGHERAGADGMRRSVRSGIIALIMICVLLPLTGCGRSYLHIGFAQSGHESDWRTMSQDYAEEAFSKEKGFLLTVSDADNYPPYQTEAVRDYIAGGYDRIIIDPLPSEDWTDILAEAEAAGIPVILINRHIDGTDKYAAWYGPDYEAEGSAAGEEVLRLSGTGVSEKKEEGRGAAAGSADLSRTPVYVIEGTSGSEAGEGRLTGLREVLGEAGLEITASAAGDFTIDGGKAAAKELSEKMSENSILVCMNDNMALGAMAALEEAKIPYGEGSSLSIVSFNAQYSGLKAVLDGRIASDIESIPEAVLKAAEALNAGEIPGGEHPNEVRVYRKDDVTEELLEGRR